jgi:hypothetical protein
MLRDINTHELRSSSSEVRERQRQHRKRLKNHIEGKLIHAYLSDEKGSQSVSEYMLLDLLLILSVDAVDHRGPRVALPKRGLISCRLYQLGA